MGCSTPCTCGCEENAQAEAPWVRRSPRVLRDPHRAHPWQVGAGRTSRLPRRGMLALAGGRLGCCEVRLQGRPGDRVSVRVGDLEAASWVIPASGVLERIVPVGYALGHGAADQIVTLSARPARPRDRSRSRARTVGMVFWAGASRRDELTDRALPALDAPLASVLGAAGGKLVRTFRGAWRAAWPADAPDPAATLAPLGFAWVGPPAPGLSRTELFTSAINMRLDRAILAKSRSGRSLPPTYRGLVFADAGPVDPTAPGMWATPSVFPLPQTATSDSLTAWEYANWHRDHWEFRHKHCHFKDPDKDLSAFGQRAVRRYRILHATLVCSLMISKLHDVVDEAGASAGAAWEPTGGRWSTYAFDLNGCDDQSNFALGWADILAVHRPEHRLVVVQTTAEAASMPPNAYQRDVNLWARLPCYGGWSTDRDDPAFQDARGKRKLYPDVADLLTAMHGVTFVFANGDGDQAGVAAGLNVVSVGAWRASEDHGLFEQTEVSPLPLDAMVKMNQNGDNSVGLLWYARWQEGGTEEGWVARGIFKPEVVGPGSQIVGVRSDDYFSGEVYKVAAQAYSWSSFAKDLARSNIRKAEAPFVPSYQWLASGTSLSAPFAGAAVAWIRQLFGYTETELTRAILFVSCIGYPKPAGTLGEATAEARRSTCVFGKVDFLGVWTTFSAGRRQLLSWGELEETRLHPVHYDMVKHRPPVELDTPGDEVVLNYVVPYTILPVSLDSVRWRARKYLRIPFLEPGRSYRLVLVWNADPAVGEWRTVNLSPDEPANAGVVDNAMLLVWLDLDGEAHMSSYANGTYRAFDFTAGPGGLAELHFLTPANDHAVTPRKLAWAIRPADLDKATESWREGGYYCLSHRAKKGITPIGNWWAYKDNTNANRRGWPVPFVDMMSTPDRET